MDGTPNATWMKTLATTDADASMSYVQPHTVAFDHEGNVIAGGEFVGDRRHGLRRFRREARPEPERQ